MKVKRTVEPSWAMMDSVDNIRPGENAEYKCEVFNMGLPEDVVKFCRLRNESMKRSTTIVEEHYTEYWTRDGAYLIGYHWWEMEEAITDMGPGYKKPDVETDMMG